MKFHFIRDVIHGDTESRAHWFTYAIGSVFGFKGLDKAGKVSVQVAKQSAQKAGQRLDELLPYHPKHQLAIDGPVPHKVYDGNFFKDQLMLKVENVSKARDKASGMRTSKYEVGSYQIIKGVDGLDAHHAGQKAVMKKLVDNYNPNTAPAINVPKVGHTIKGPNGIVSRNTKGIDNPRQLLARDIRELRRVYDDISNSSLKELIKLNKKCIQK